MRYPLHKLHVMNGITLSRSTFDFSVVVDFSAAFFALAEALRVTEDFGGLPFLRFCGTTAAGELVIWVASDGSLFVSSFSSGFVRTTGKLVSTSVAVAFSSDRGKLLLLRLMAKGTSLICTALLSKSGLFFFFIPDESIVFTGLLVVTLFDGWYVAPLPPVKTTIFEILGTRKETTYFNGWAASDRNKDIEVQELDLLHKNKSKKNSSWWLNKKQDR